MYAAVQPRESLCILKRNIARTTIFGFLRILQILVGYLLRENKKTKKQKTMKKQREKPFPRSLYLEGVRSRTNQDKGSVTPLSLVSHRYRNWWTLLWKHKKQKTLKKWRRKPFPRSLYLAGVRSRTIQDKGSVTPRGLISHSYRNWHHNS
jgi:hypothetical protein